MEFSHTTGIAASKIRATAKKLSRYIDRLAEITEAGDYSADESSLNCPFDAQAVHMVTRAAAKFDRAQLKCILVIGIGGSNLGTQAVYDALRGHYEAVSSDAHTKMLFLDTVDAAYLEKLSVYFKKSGLAKDEFAVVLISKSGTTTETIANAEVFFSSVLHNRGSISDRIAVITDEGSKLWEYAQARDILALPIPKIVGGRFSVFTPVGLFPLLLAGFNITEFLVGAQHAHKYGVSKDPVKNSALASAAILFLSHANGKAIHDTFIFSPALESLGKWYRQLLGESIGKEFTTKKKRVNCGITPTVSIGSTDLHSVGQLYLAGPRDKVTTFVSVDGSHEHMRVPAVRTLPLVPEISGASIDHILSAIVSGVQRAYRSKKLPCMHIHLDAISERSLGEFMQMKMLEIMYLAQLLQVNAFDQPSVELYKKETRRLLSRA